MKIKYSVIVLILTLFIPFNIKAIDPDINYIPGVYSNRMGDRLYSGQLGYIYMDGRILYCLDPFKIIGKNYFIDNSYQNNYKDEDLKYMQAVASFASDFYVGNFDAKSIYMAAQELIWDRLIGKGKISWTSEINGQGTIINTELDKNYLDNMVTSFYRKPSFDGMLIKEKCFNKYTLIDTNGVLKYYKVVQEPNDPNIITVNGDKVVITLLSNKLREIKFVKTKGEGSLKIYNNGGSNQTIADLNNKIESVSTIKVQAINENNSNFDIQFVDAKTNRLVTDNINFSINDNYYNTANGKFFINLKVGKHILKVSDVPKDYVLTNDKVLKVSENNTLENQAYTVYLKHATGNLEIINKGYDKLKLYKKDKTLLYEFKDNQSYDLDLGEYYITDEKDNIIENVILEYKDQNTKVVKKTVVLEKIDEKINNKDDNKKEIADNTEEENNIDNKKESNDEKVEQNIVDNSDNEVKEEKKTIINEDKMAENQKLIDSQDDKANIEKAKQDDIKEEQAKQFSILPNTFNYLLYIKLLLILISLVCLKKLK